MSTAPVKFQNGQASSVAVVVAFAAISLVALDFFWLRVLYIAVSQLRNRASIQKKLSRERHIFHSQLGAYTVSLLISNLFSSVSFVLNAAYLTVGQITPGALCRSQATLSQVADVATAYFTGAIAVHTFNSLVLHRRLPVWFCGLVVVFGWMASIVMATVPAHFETKYGPFYTIDGALCGISADYQIWETCIHLLPIFVASLVAVLFYALVFLIIRGTLAFRGGLKFNLDPEARRSTMYGNFESPKFIASVARSMLWYPAAYIALMFPHLIVCFMSASGIKVTFASRIFTAACSALLGLANVLVFCNSIRVMGPAFESPAPSEESVGSFGGREKSGSPVDVAPPAAAFVRPAKAFPPPRSVSTISSSESTRVLLASRYRHAYSGSVASTSESASIGRPITPASDLNQIIATPQPTASKGGQLFHLNIAVPEEEPTSLPAPRRSARATIVRQSVDQSILTAVPLKTPAGAAFPQNRGFQRDSFINMYASRSPVPEPGSSSSAEPKGRVVPPALVLNDGDAATVPSSGSSGYTTSTASDVPSSAFADKKQLSATHSRSFRSTMRDRMSTIEVPEGGLSPIAWASIVADAASSNGGVSAQQSDKAARRRSRSMDGLAVPSTLRPRVPVSATLRREFPSTELLMPPMSAGLPPRYQNRLARLDSKAGVRSSQSKMATLSTSSDSM
ncbi:uncharacterized protein PHACADRAFT_252814 [Phanerochaete carnosa HHB-10118-sp]|uniref:G-protein coupled receptors family 1 profile domain-containing protein n=1 Tax=Phanerochaete carnosa (strain HHB-10118-sp) TaxID=650164 RepID=K5WGM2_PHACS|nr:uncharacterized protein PHACADRAFT_252814 [Phanerochaete carnosa HHB-10118-sp]EKM58470.1 hypothetical protein PHACADRAFT_252814 [Phanerochaete carnosa HHB-10118-sp]